jgi:hypothetical protein
VQRVCQIGVELFLIAEFDGNHDVKIGVPLHTVAIHLRIVQKGQGLIELLIGVRDLPVSCLEVCTGFEL